MTGTVRLWDARSGEALANWNVDGGPVAVAFSPSNDRIAVGTLAFPRLPVSTPGPIATLGTILVLKTTSARPLLRLATSSGLSSLVFTTDGTAIVYGGQLDSAARIVDARSGRALAVLRGHDDAVTQVAVSPDGTRIVTGSADRTVRIWDAQRYDSLLTLRLQGAVDDVTVSPDGAALAAAASGQVLIWRSGLSAEPLK